MKNRYSIGSVVIIAIFISGMAPAAGALDLAEGLLLYESGNMAGAQAVFAELVEKDPGNDVAVYHLGMTQFEQSDLDAAIDSFTRAIALDDKQSRYYQKLGEALGNKAGTVGTFKQIRMAGSIRDAFTKAVELDGDNIDARFGLITYYLAAPAIAGGSISEATAQAETIQELDELRGLMAFASIYSDQGEYDKAESAYRAAIQEAPDQSDLYLALGIQLTDQERYADAIAVYENGLDNLPDDMSINYQIGRTASISGEFLEQGREALKAYLENHMPRAGQPSLAWASYRLGSILQHLGQNDQARAAFEDALRLDPKHKEAKKALRRLR